MTVDTIAQSVQFTFDRHGNITAVVLTPELWHQMLAALEDTEDLTLLRALKERIAVGPAAAGALRWEDIVKDWA